MITLLCVDGCAKQRLLYEQGLRIEGYDVITASDGRVAMERVRWMHIDLIIMDISKPQMEGLEAIGRIIGKNRRDPIIILTAYVNKRADFMSWAVDACVVKSSDLTELKSKIRELIREESSFVHHEMITT